MFDLNGSKAIAYCRVATVAQAKHHDSLEIQKRKITEFAKRKNIEIVEWFEDVNSGTGRHNQIGLEKAHEYCMDHSGISYLITTKPDRISRSINICYYWQNTFYDKGIMLVCADDISEQDIIILGAVEPDRQWYAALSKDKNRLTFARLSEDDIERALNPKSGVN